MGHPWGDGEGICLYGWDSRSETWHGPNELGRILPDKRLLQALRGAPGRSWHGQVKCGTSDQPATGSSHWCTTSPIVQSH